jgi:hypothetical protein
MSKVKIDKRNIQTFLKNGTSNSESMIYRCVLCECDTCIDNSASNQGKNLICMSCFRSNFVNTTSAFRWIDSNDFNRVGGLKNETV